MVPEDSQALIRVTLVGAGAGGPPIRPLAPGGPSWQSIRRTDYVEEAQAMANALVSVPSPRNEPVLSYAPGTPERRALRAQLERMSKEVVEITPRIGGRKVETGRVGDAVMPHNHHHALARWHKEGPP